MNTEQLPSQHGPKAQRYGIHCGIILGITAVLCLYRRASDHLEAIAQVSTLVLSQLAAYLLLCLLPVLSLHKCQIPGWRRAVFQGGLSLADALPPRFLSTAKDAVEPVVDLISYRRERQLLSLFADDRLGAEERKELMAECEPRQRLKAVRKEFAYNPKQQLFLIRAVLRMIWWPMVPLYIADTLLQAVGMAAVVLNGVMLNGLDNLSQIKHPQWYIVGIALLLLVAKIVGSQAARVQSQISAEWSRVGRAIELEFARLPLSSAGLRNEYTRVVGEASVLQLLSGLRSIQETSVQALTLAAALVPLWRRLHWLLVIPLCVSMAKAALHYLLTNLVGSRWECMDIPMADTPRDVVGNIHREIHAVKLFGWERLYLDAQKRPRQQQQQQQATPGYFRIAFIKGMWALLDIVDRVRDKLSAALIVGLSGRFGMLGTAMTAGDLLWISSMVGRQQTVLFALLHVARQVHSLVECHQVIQKFLRGDFWPTLAQRTNGPARIRMQKCSFRWPEADTRVLEKVTLDIPAGSLALVEGSVGNGKSALLLAMCREVEMAAGSGFVGGTVAYVGQTPWLFNDTMQANILFGRPLDSIYYERVLFACALTADVEQWADGDQKKVGEAGANISGGQRARIALARALYARADIYVLDDPLAAVDALTKRHIIEHVLLGMLAQKTRVVASSTPHIHPFADQLMAVAGGTVVARVQSRQRWSITRRKPVNVPIGRPRSQPQLQQKPTNAFKETARWMSRSWTTSSNMRFLVRTLTWPVVGVLVIASCIMPAVCYMLHQMLLTNQASKDVVRETAAGLAVHATWALEGVARQQATQRASSAFAHGIIYAPLTFFDATSPAGLQQGFSEGVMGVVDAAAGLFTSELAVIVGAVLDAFRLVGAVPLLLLVVPALSYIEHRLLRFSGHAATTVIGYLSESSARKSHVDNLISSGARMIRILQAAPHFSLIHNNVSDRYGSMSTAFDCLLSLTTLLKGMMADIREFLVVLVLLLQANGGFKEPHKTLLSTMLLEHVILAHSLAAGCRQLLELPQNATTKLQNVNVLRRYSELPPESPRQETPIDANWPPRGGIEFRNVSMKYREDLDLALNNINLVVKPGEKIGVVGPSGAGKSSLLKALFCMVPSTSGQILIDDCDVSTINSPELRPRLGAVPQESVMLAGSFRDNLDPLHEFTIEDMYAALIKCGAVSIITRAPSPHSPAMSSRIGTNTSWMRHLYLWAMGDQPAANQYEGMVPLDKPVDSNLHLSTGQRQLFSLCRLLLRRRPIVVLDEATADMDPETDTKIQGLIQKELHQSTILTIAHRLETVMSSDRIVVMDKGRIVEVGSPQELLAKNGFFANMVKSNTFWK